MVDVHTGLTIDMIESRELEDVKAWLLTYPNIQLVSRDGSKTYTRAITESHAQAIQVSDRFHLIKSLCTKLKKHLQSIIQGRIQIPISSETQKIRHVVALGTIKDKVSMVKQFRKTGLSQQAIILKTGLDERTVRKYLQMDSDKLPNHSLTVRGIEHEKAIAKLKKRALLVQNLKEKGMSIHAIHKETGFTTATVKRYLASDFNPVNAHYGK